MLDLKSIEKNVKIKVDKILEGTFDTRPGGIDPAEVRAIAAEGALGERPLLTTDFIPVKRP